MFPTIANHNPTTAMNKRLLIIATALFLSLPSARAQLVVEDVLSIAQDAVNQVVDLAKYVEMVNNQVQQINTMTQELQQTVAYVKAFGDPAQLLEITGVNELMSELDLSGVGQTLGEIRQTASGIQSLKNNATGLYQEITDFSLSGIEVPRVPDIYKPFSALENASSNYTAVYDDVTQRRQTLKGQMVGTIDRLQASTTDAETQKLQGVVTAQAAQLQSIDNEIANAASQAVVQDISNRNNDQKQQQARDEAIAADRHDAMKKYGTMLVPDVSAEVRFGRSAK
jgi:hypothetical protein